MHWRTHPELSLPMYLWMGEEDRTPVFLGGSASETSIHHGRLPCAEVSLWAGDLSVYTFTSDLIKP
jgi:hypothetical protein